MLDRAIRIDYEVLDADGNLLPGNEVIPEISFVNMSHLLKYYGKEGLLERASNAKAKAEIKQNSSDMAALFALQIGAYVADLIASHNKVFVRPNGEMFRLTGGFTAQVFSVYT